MKNEIVKKRMRTFGTEDREARGLAASVTKVRVLPVSRLRHYGRRVARLPPR